MLASYKCGDRTCGAYDCEDCYPGCNAPCEGCGYPNHDCKCDDIMIAILDKVYDPNMDDDVRYALEDGEFLGSLGLEGLKKWLVDEKLATSQELQELHDEMRLSNSPEDEEYRRYEF